MTREDTKTGMGVKSPHRNGGVGAEGGCERAVCQRCTTLSGWRAVSPSSTVPFEAPGPQAGLSGPSVLMENVVPLDCRSCVLWGFSLGLLTLLS